MTTEKEIRSLARTAGLGGSVGAQAPVLPDGIVGFATDRNLLGLDIYPRQGSLLKLMTADLDALTEYDHEVINEWTQGFRLDDQGGVLAYRGERGVPPDVLERMLHLRDLGRPWFRECVLVIGRRGSKSFICSVMVCWVLWRLIAMDDPQAHYSIPATKKLVIPVFGTDQISVRRDGFGDLAGLLESSPCFQPFLGAKGANSISLLTPAQLRGGAQPGDAGLILIVAAPSTTTAGRGPSSPAMWFDEMGHVVGMGSTADSIELYGSAVPATGQFPDALILQSSTPWARSGQLYKSYTQALQLSPGTGKALVPDSFVVQLESSALYDDAEEAHRIPMWPGGPNYPKGLKPKVTYEYIEAQLKTDPERARIEWLGQFGSVSHPYLLPDRAAAVFAPFKERVLEQEAPALLARRYVAHADPSRSNANFALAIGHLEAHDGVPHVVFDLIRHWEPHDFPDGIIDYLELTEIAYSYLKQYRIAEFTFDQFSSVQSIQDLQRRVRIEGLSWHPQILERTATAKLNDQMFELFKTAVHGGLVHAPAHALAQAELEHLMMQGNRVVAPTSGPVTTKDIADAMANVAWTLLRDHTDQVFRALSGLPVSGSHPGGFHTSQPPGGPGDPHRQLSHFGRVNAYRMRQRAIRRAP